MILINKKNMSKQIELHITVKDKLAESKRRIDEAKKAITELSNAK